MEIKDLFKIIRNRQKTIFWVTLAVLAIAVVFTISQPFQYSTKTKLLIIQDSATDPYSISRSNEYLGRLYGEVAYSSTFIDLVKKSNFGIDYNYFTFNQNQMAKKWKHDIRVQAVGDTGVINITVYHQNPAQSQALALGVTKVLMTENYNYQGINNTTKISVIDQPMTSNYPNRPNLILNLGGGLILGLLISLFWISVFPKREKREISVSSVRIKPTRFVSNEKPVIKERAIPLNDDMEEEIDLEDEGNIMNVLR
jgi:capsular polysaccharide biosynthesis protein